MKTIKIAKKRERIAAFFLDFTIFMLIFLVFGIFFGTPKTDTIGFTITGFPAFILSCIGFILWPVTESLTGKTIGKKLIGLKVISNNNKNITFGQAFLRFIFGFVDYIFLIGLIVASTNNSNKRIRDYIANTKVIDIE